MWGADGDTAYRGCLGNIGRMRGRARQGGRRSVYAELGISLLQRPSVAQVAFTSTTAVTDDIAEEVAERIPLSRQPIYKCILCDCGR